MEKEAPIYIGISYYVNGNGIPYIVEEYETIPCKPEEIKHLATTWRSKKHFFNPKTQSGDKIKAGDWDNIKASDWNSFRDQVIKKNLLSWSLDKPCIPENVNNMISTVIFNLYNKYMDYISL